MQIYTKMYTECKYSGNGQQSFEQKYDRIDISKFSSLNTIVHIRHVLDAIRLSQYVVLLLVSRHLLSDPYHDFDSRSRDIYRYRTEGSLVQQRHNNNVWKPRFNKLSLHIYK